MGIFISNKNSWRIELCFKEFLFIDKIIYNGNITSENRLSKVLRDSILIKTNNSFICNQTSSELIAI